jgi:hypothetical protein
MITLVLGLFDCFVYGTLLFGHHLFRPELHCQLCESSGLSEQAEEYDEKVARFHEAAPGALPLAFYAHFPPQKRQRTHPLAKDPLLIQGAAVTQTSQPDIK